MDQQLSQVVADAHSQEASSHAGPTLSLPFASMADVIQSRNQSWQGKIPSWVKLDDVGLDRFFTRPEVAAECHESLLNVMSDDYADVSAYHFIEPSAGESAFYFLLPEARRIGIEIVPGENQFLCQDYLSWQPSDNDLRYAVIGNPPFGYRAWLALAFLNHSAIFADYVGMILPMAFQSDGKGNPKFRVRGAELVASAPLPKEAFVTPEGKSVQVNALWQVWRRGVNNRPPVTTCDQWVDLFTVDMRKERLCGQQRLDEAHWFLQRTFYNEPPKLVDDFSAVRYVCGYGIVIKQKVDKVTKALNGVDWTRYSNLAAHNCHHISMYHIRQALIDMGFTDG